MSAKDVHVKSYTRDGEKVREHWRSHPDTGIDDVVSSAVKQAVLRGGVEHTDISLDSIVDVIRDIANKGKDAWNKIPKPIKTVLAQALIQSVLYNPSSAANAKVVSGGQRLRNVATNKDLSATKLRGGVVFKDYAQKENNNNMKNLQNNLKNINHYNLTDKEMYIKNSSQDLIKQHGQIENNYKIRDNFDDLPKDLLKYFSTNSDKEKMSLRFKHYQPFIDNNPELARTILWNIGEFARYVDNTLTPSSELLMTCLNFSKYAPKIKDSIIIKSYKETGALSEFVKEKLESQNMDPETTPGIIHGFQSRMSQEIANSAEVKRFAKNYRKALIEKQLVSTSITFNSTRDLYTGINNADILFAYINEDNGNLIMCVLDTYDFNKSDVSSLVRNGYSAQNAGLLDLYFNIFFVEIPQYKL